MVPADTLRERAFALAGGDEGLGPSVGFPDCTLGGCWSTSCSLSRWQSSADMGGQHPVLPGLCSGASIAGKCPFCEAAPSCSLENRQQAFIGEETFPSCC